MQPTLAITTQQILCDIYTPGVARVYRGDRALEELLPEPLDLETHGAVTAAVRADAIESVSTAVVQSSNKHRPAHGL
jgi:hypothetical protein